MPVERLSPKVGSKLGMHIPVLVKQARCMQHSSLPWYILLDFSVESTSNPSVLDALAATASTCSCQLRSNER